MKKRKSHMITLGSFLCIFLVLLGFACNTLLFNKTINRLSVNYLNDNNRQLASHISYRIKVGNEFAADFAATLSRMPQRLLTEELLERKAQIMELEGLGVLSRDQPLMSCGHLPDLSQWAAQRPEIWEEPVVSYIEDAYLLFSAPVERDDGTEQVVVGIQSYHEIQALVNRAHYQRNGVSILYDMDIEEPIIQDKGSKSTISQAEITHILEDLPQHTGTAEEEHGIYISTEPISGTNWIQVSIIPAGVLLEEMGQYVMVYLALIFVGFLMLLAAVCYFKKLARQREQYFRRDALTDGYNREGFLAEGGHLLERLEPAGYSVVCMNVCNFRQINEMWGEDAGDKTLRFIYRMMQENLSEAELICRSNVDHFLLLLREREESAISGRVAQILARINEVVLKRFGAYNLDFTIGSCSLSVVENLNAAINNASYMAKHTPKQNACVFYNKDTARKIAEINQLNDLFDESIAQRHFEMYLQPKVHTQPGKPCQAEALVRWKHPERGFIFPNQFIPLLEKNGKICILDLYMFEEVCRLVDRWIRTGEPVTEISVNISRYHLKNAGSDVWKAYKEIKDRYNIPDGVIEIELTETMMVDQTQLSFVKYVLDQFRACGLKVALDDFGFAYSSLALLKEFEIDTLKLDRTFFINETNKSRTVVGNIIQLAHNLGMSVVAEGIEEQTQVEALSKNHCDLIQGYVYARPLPVADFEKWRSAHETT